MKNNGIVVFGIIAVIIFVIYRGNKKKISKPVANSNDEIDEMGEMEVMPIMSGGGGGGGSFGGDITTPVTTTPVSTTPVSTTPVFTTPTIFPPNISIAPITTTANNPARPNISIKPYITPALIQNISPITIPNPSNTMVLPKTTTPKSSFNGSNQFEFSNFDSHFDLNF